MIIPDHSGSASLQVSYKLTCKLAEPLDNMLMFMMFMMWTVQPIEQYSFFYFGPLAVLTEVDTGWRLMLSISPRGQLWDEVTDGAFYCLRIQHL